MTWCQVAYIIIGTDRDAGIVDTGGKNMSTEITEGEIKLIRECVRAAYLGPFFPDDKIEFLSLKSRDYIKSTDEEITELDLKNIDHAFFVSSVMANLLYYPYGTLNEEEKWPEYISAGKSELRALFGKLLKYFDENDIKLSTPPNTFNKHGG